MSTYVLIPYIMEDVHDMYIHTFLQVCQTSNLNETIAYPLAQAGTEQMYIDADGTPYVFYTGPAGRQVLWKSSSHVQYYYNIQ
jgi:hypothetical protein